MPLLRVVDDAAKQLFRSLESERSQITSAKRFP